MMAGEMVVTPAPSRVLHTQMAPLKQTHMPMHKSSTSNGIEQQDEPQNSSVQVAVRIRPLFDHEEDRQGYLNLHGQNNLVDIVDIPVPIGGLIKTISAHSNSTKTTIQQSGSDSSSSFMNSEPILPILSYQTVEVGEGDSSQNYTFDHVFPQTSKQEDLYEKCVTPLVQSCLEGYNATVLAYGQTGSGKTHTILGDVNNHYGINEEETEFTDTPEAPPLGMRKEAGVIPRALWSIFDGLEEKKSFAAAQSAAMDADFGRDPSPTRRGRSISSPQSTTCSQSPFEYSINIQFVELYGEEIRDLLNAPEIASQPRGRPGMVRRYNSTSNISKIDNSGWRLNSGKTVTIRDGKAGEGAELIGAENIEVNSVQEALDHLKEGLTKRVVGRTAMNAHSSRSHAIFSVVIHQTTRKPIGKGFRGDGAGNEKVSVEMKTSKIHFVDLCGSERIKRAETTGKRLKEGIDINKGLLVLGNVISALGRVGPKAHVPYRDSKLTRILKGSLGGNHKTLMIACISKSPSNESETKSTLRYANRAKNIRNHAKINVDPQYEVVQQLRSRVAALAAELLRMRNRGFDDDDDEHNPFSIDFLKDLVDRTDQPRREKNYPTRRKNSHAQVKINQRPTSSPMISSQGVSLKRNVSVSWHEGPSELFHDKSEHDGHPDDEHDDHPDDNSAEDPELAKNIESYDFALATLRQSLESKNQRQSFYEGDTHQLDKWENGAIEDSPIQRSRNVSLSPERAPELKKIRNIDELYDYLNDHTHMNEEGEIVDDEGTVISQVVNSHVIKLDDAISQNERLLKEMEACHEIFEGSRSDNNENLAEIETELQLSRNEKEGLEKVKEDLDGDFENSKGLMKALAVKDAKISELSEERDDLIQLNENTHENLKSIQDLQNSIVVMKKQRSDLTNITSRPRSRGRDPPSLPILEASSIETFIDTAIDTSSRVYREGLPLTPENMHELRATRSAKTNPMSNQTGHMTGFDLVIDQSEADAHMPRSRLTTDEAGDKLASDVPTDGRRQKSNRHALANSRHNKSNENIPRILETSLNTSHHSKISLLETPGFGPNHFTEPYKRGRTVREIRNEIEKNRTSFATRPDVAEALLKMEKITRRSLYSGRVSPTEEVASVYRRQLSKKDDQTVSTLASPRSVFDVVEESMASSKMHSGTNVSLAGKTKKNYESETEEPVWCGAESIVNTIREIFGLKNPVLRQWDA